MENKKSSVSFLTTLLVIMSIALVILLYIFFNMKKENEATIRQLEEYTSIIEEKKNSLEKELNSIILQYDSLKTNNDTLNLKLEDQQNKIKRLLALRINDAEKIKKYEKELETIREVLRSYIVQIDSLNTKNQILTVENKELRNTRVKLQTQNKQLSEEKEVLRKAEVK